MDSLTIIDALANAPGRLDKEQILFSAFMSGNREFFIASRLAYDPLIKFGIAKAALIEEDDGSAGTYQFSDFLALADKLYHRELTGHAARDAINAAAQNCHAKTWNTFYRRVLLKDLKIGVEDKTINKVLGRINGEARDYLIPIFGCQLAHDGAKEEHARKVSGEKMLDIKLDGVRMISILDKESEVTQFTRNGKQNDNFEDLRGSLSRIMAELPGSVMLDAEVTGLSFQALMTQVNRRTDVDTSENRLALFDIVPLSDFRAGRCDIPQRKRHEILAELAPMIQRVSNGLVYVVPKVTVDLDTPEGQETFTQFNRDAIEAGYEGIMVKNPDAPYETKRTTAWLKIKPFIEVSLEVVGFEEGDAEGKYRGTLGALVCRGEDDGDKISVKVGSGLTDDMRKKIWENPDAYLGLIAEIRADAKTLERGSDVYSLRFPRFKGFRGFTPGEKL